MLNIFGFFSLFGGLALFLYGMSVLGGSLEKVSGGRLEHILEKLTDNLIKGVLLGLLVTAAIQSSSATTVIVVGLVNARLLKLRPAIGIIMGANIGTTITAHILRLSGMSSDNLMMNLLRPSSLACIFAVAGILVFFLGQKDRIKNVGLMLLGFGILFTGMLQMESAVAPLREVPAFARLFQSMTNPLLGVAVGAAVTAIVQSSSASVGILQALSTTGDITCAAAFPLIMGQNIGTCITSLLASVGTSKAAKRAAVVHLSFNIIGTILFLIVTYGVQSLIGIPFWNDPIDKGGIANFHTVFNLTVTLVLMPFAGALERLAYAVIPRDEKESGQVSSAEEVLAGLDDRLTTSTGLALKHTRDAVLCLADLARTNMELANGMLTGAYDSATAEQIRANEIIADRFQDRIEAYLLQISKNHNTEAQKNQISQLLHMNGEFERIADQAENIMRARTRLYNAGGAFSEMATMEMRRYGDAVSEILNTAIMAYRERDLELAVRIEPLEQVIDIMEEQFKSRHIQRLRDGQCGVDAAFAFVEALSNMERIADHCSNVGIYILSAAGSVSYETHAYQRALHRGNDETYCRLYKEYEEKYMPALR